jgi:hypothetical protein
MDGLMDVAPSVELLNGVLGGRREGRSIGRGGVSEDGSSVSPEPGGEVLRDG